MGKKKVKFTAKKKHNPKSEAAQRKAVKLQNTLAWRLSSYKLEVIAEDMFTGEPVAVFNLRDCYRKRQPVRGLGKAVTKLLKTKRK